MCGWNRCAIIPKPLPALTPDDWRARANEAWFTCEIDGVFAGTAKYWRDTWSAKTAHVAHLGAMYVRGGFRGQGVGDALIEAVIALARGEGAELVLLGVHTKNLSAQALYERHGFKRFGMLPGALKVDGVSWDEIHMVRSLAPVP
jgi:GNAT superfamily N-acetyltransferase